MTAQTLNSQATAGTLHTRAATAGASARWCASWGVGGRENNGAGGGDGGGGGGGGSGGGAPDASPLGTPPLMTRLSPPELSAGAQRAVLGGGGGEDFGGAMCLAGPGANFRSLLAPERPPNYRLTARPPTARPPDRRPPDRCSWVTHHTTTRNENRTVPATDRTVDFRQCQGKQMRISPVFRTAL